MPGLARYRCRAERDQFIGEEIALGQREAQLLSAVLGIDKAADNRGRELVGVVDPVATGEVVFGKYLREIEIGQGAVEVRQLILRPERDVDVVQTRLQGLSVGPAKEFRIQFESKRAINAVDRNLARLRRSALVLEGIVGVVVTGLWREIKKRCLQRQ